MSSPTQLTLKELRKRGYQLVQVVEHWNPHAMRRVDLFGIIDVLAVGQREDLFDGAAQVVGVQTTSDHNVSAHLKKLKAAKTKDGVQVLPVLSAAGVTVLVHGWRKRNGEYRLREIDLSKPRTR